MRSSSNDGHLSWTHSDLPWICLPSALESILLASSVFLIPRDLHSPSLSPIVTRCLFASMESILASSSVQSPLLPVQVFTKSAPRPWLTCLCPNRMLVQKGVSMTCLRSCLLMPPSSLVGGPTRDSPENHHEAWAPRRSQSHQPPHQQTGIWPSKPPMDLSILLGSHPPRRPLLTSSGRRLLTNPTCSEKTQTAATHGQPPFRRGTRSSSDAPLSSSVRSNIPIMSPLSMLHYP